MPKTPEPRIITMQVNLVDLDLAVTAAEMFFHQLEAVGKILPEPVLAGLLETLPCSTEHIAMCKTAMYRLRGELEEASKAVSQDELREAVAQRRREFADEAKAMLGWLDKQRSGEKQ